MNPLAFTRRDRCYVIGRRAAKLQNPVAAVAWHHLAAKLEELGDRDVPKFNDLLIAIRVAHLKAIGYTGKRK